MGKAQQNVVVSFVHGYNDLNLQLAEGPKPALLSISEDGADHFSYPFPRNPADFERLGDVFAGDAPFKTAENFKKLPRFGFTGLAESKSSIFAGSWNGVYQISKTDFRLRKFISNHLMNDMHGIYADEEVLITVLTSRDTIVISDHSGRVIEHFAVGTGLEVYRDTEIDGFDWRFISKQFRGSCGFWHFNYIQKFGSEIWLTSRNANCFVVVDLSTRKARLRLMNHTTPTLIHDGVRHGEKFYFTSIDGKILISQDAQTVDGKVGIWEDPGNLALYHRDLVTELIRLNETALKREPNWCRGLAVKDGVIYVAIDGRYDSDLSFGLLALREDTKEILLHHRMKWSQVGNEKEIRYVTGFDVLVV